MNLRRAAQILFVYTLLVIVWGAWVRISHSGDGCGDSWPLCQGNLVPDAPAGKTWVEYTHRLMSGLYGIFVFALWWIVRRRFRDDQSLRRWANGMLIFTVTEAALGAKLVLFKLVSGNGSWARTAVMSLHQINSLLLTVSVTGLALHLLQRTMVTTTKPAPRAPALKPRTILVGILFGLIAITGAWASLSSTLFPSESLWEGLQRDFSPAEHHLIRLRVLHPLAALLGGGGLAVFFWMRSYEGGPDQKIHQQTALLLMAGLIFGICTLLLLSPVWMKLTHLALAHLMAAALARWALGRGSSLKPVG